MKSDAVRSLNIAVKELRHSQIIALLKVVRTIHAKNKIKPKNKKKSTK